MVYMGTEQLGPENVLTAECEIAYIRAVESAPPETANKTLSAEP